MTSQKLALTGIAAATFSISAITAAQSGLTANSLEVDGLNYETELTALYLGDFDNARLQNNDMRFSVLLDEYIDAYSRKCPAALPRDKIEITKSRCIRESTPVNVYGNPVGATTCDQYETYGTGRYADPELMRASKSLQAALTRGMLGDALGLSGGDPLQWSRQAADVALSFGDDMPNLLTKNSCSSAAVRRLQTNIQRFADGAAPTKLASGATLQSRRANAVASTNLAQTDYASLVDALISENARGWSFNRYVAGSASSVSVTGQDSAGRPRGLNARYSFNGFSGRQNGSVRISFKDGVPDCMYFFDAPNVCRLPSRRVITAYEKGEY